MEPVDEIRTGEGILGQLSHYHYPNIYQSLTYERLREAIEEVVTERSTRRSSYNSRYGAQLYSYGYDDYGWGSDLIYMPTPRAEREKSEYDRWRECQKNNTHYVPRKIINEEDNK